MGKKSNQNIHALQDGPCKLDNLAALDSTQGDKIRLDPEVFLCRCGKSRDKPFCDKSHIESGFSSEKLEGRQPDRVDDYVGKQITIHDNRGVCSHRGHCTDNLPSVFRMKTEPWIDPDGADPKEVARVIRMCPSGALSYTKDGVHYTKWEKQPKIRLKKNGPYEVEGSIAFKDEGQNTPQTEDHYTLCRCGGSKNKPFCDGTHWYNGFRDEKEIQDNTKRNTDRHMQHIQHMASTGESIQEPMGISTHVPSWDQILIKGAQLAKIPVNEDVPVSLKTIIGPKAKKPLQIDIPVYVTHMSFGALSREAKIALSKGSSMAKTAMCSGEGGILEDSRKEAFAYIFEYVPNQYSVTEENLKKADAVEIKIGQAVKPGLGGHFPGAKITDEIAEIRQKPKGRDILSPANYPDIQSPEQLKEKIAYLRTVSGGKPIGVKIAAGDVPKDLAVALAGEPDFVTIDGMGGATGAAHKFIKDSASIPTLFALAQASKYFQDHHVEGVSLVITGGLRVSSDIAKAIALGADAVAIGTAALMAIGCQQYRMCHTGKCPTGVTTHDPHLRKRIDIDQSAERLCSFLTVTAKELELFTRMCGYQNIHDLTKDVLSTMDLSISMATGISLG